MKIISINEDTHYLNVEIVAASEISFDVKMVDDYDQQLTDLCNIIPVMIKVDMDLIEFYDSPSTKNQPSKANIAAIKSFYRKYSFKNCRVPFEGFEDKE